MTAHQPGRGQRHRQLSASCCPARDLQKLRDGGRARHETARRSPKPASRGAYRTGAAPRGRPPAAAGSAAPARRAARAHAGQPGQGLVGHQQQGSPAAPARPASGRHCSSCSRSRCVAEAVQLRARAPPARPAACHQTRTGNRERIANADRAVVAISASSVVNRGRAAPRVGSRSHRRPPARPPDEPATATACASAPSSATMLKLRTPAATRSAPRYYERSRSGHHQPAAERDVLLSQAGRRWRRWRRTGSRATPAKMLGRGDAPARPRRRY